MAAEMCPVIEKALDQGFANVHQMFQQSAARFNTGAEITATEAARMFLHETQLIGSLAASRLDQSATANKTLELNAAADQPRKPT